MWYIKKPPFHSPRRMLFIHHKHGEEDWSYNIIIYSEKIKKRTLWCSCGSVVPKHILLQCQLLICQ